MTGFNVRGNEFLRNSRARRTCTMHVYLDVLFNYFVHTRALARTHTYVRIGAGGGETMPEEIVENKKQNVRAQRERKEKKTLSGIKLQIPFVLIIFFFSFALFRNKEEKIQ